MQSLLGRSHWDADRLRDEVRDYVVEALGDEDGVLIFDETGFAHKAIVPPVLRVNTPGRRVGLRTARSAYATVKLWSIIDYLSESWTKDRARCAKAPIPATVEFATKPRMARHGQGGARCGRPMRLRY
ncbi:transposase [Mesorhizobium sp. M6A.T.Cr.TU.016.01.1.1]|uniref:transposase n=1 Tax=Mesorhizobium sp. M6A.T.Cr.TU.016.01.1.1 TaxID=2493677 RepID=UPI000F74E9D6|nr:transposase [Mesorhizobium sp. M6A.T.Cr.TU.016.01.1.1]AZO66366.1 hypothetical protein EJ075_16490 [Mesorhizobium sp. M6A.T.Cr.TU.016.01.1.1]